MARLKSSLWVDAYIRRVNLNGGFAALLKKGHADAGAIYIEIDHLNGHMSILKPEFDPDFDERKWRFHIENEPCSRADIVDYFAKERNFDPDIWIISVEDSSGVIHIDDEFIIRRSVS